MNQQQLKRYLDYLNQDKTNVNLLLAITDCYLEAGDWQQAQHYLDQAQAVNADNGWTQQGVIDMNTGQLTKAKRSFKLALKLKNKLVDRYRLSYCHYLLKEFSEGFKVLETLQPEENTLEIRLLKARFLHHLARIDEAVVLLEETMRIYPVKPDCIGLLSLLYYDQDQSEQAERLSRQTLSLDANNYEGQLVQVLLKAGNLQISVAEIEALIQINTQDCRLWFLLGTAYLHNHDFTTANQAFTKATYLWPDFYDNWISLGWCQLFQNDLPQAEHSFKRACEVDCQSADGWGGLALVYALTNQVEKAREMQDKAFALNPECFIAQTAAMLLSNTYSPDLAAEQFKTLFPALHASLKNIPFR